MYGEDENAAFAGEVRRARAQRQAGNLGPALERLEAGDDRVALVFDEPVDADSVPPSGAFRVVAPPSHVVAEVTDVEASGARVVLTLASRLRPGTTVGITYNVPDGDAIRDADGLQAAGITWRTAKVTSVAPVWQSTVTVGARDGCRGYSSIANPQLGAVADDAFDYGEGATHQAQAVLAHSGGVMFQVRNRSDAISDLVLEWAGETLPLADATWTANRDRCAWDQAWLRANAPSLAAPAYATTLADGSTTAVCLRFAEQSCPEAPSASGSGAAPDDATSSSLTPAIMDNGTFPRGHRKLRGNGRERTQAATTQSGRTRSRPVIKALEVGCISRLQQGTVARVQLLRPAQGNLRLPLGTRITSCAGVEHRQLRQRHPQAGGDVGQVIAKKLVATHDVRQTPTRQTDLPPLRQPVAIGERVCAIRRVQPRADLVEAARLGNAMVSFDHGNHLPAVSAADLVGIERMGPRVGIPDERKRQVVSRSRLFREQRRQRAALDQLNVRIRILQGRDQAPRRHLRIADPEESIAVRHHLLRGKVRLAQRRAGN